MLEPVFQRCPRFLTGFAACLVAIATANVVIAQTKPPDDSDTYIKIEPADRSVQLNFDSVTLDLALLLKVRGDEYFIQSQPRAGDMYSAAKRELSKINPEHLPVTGRNVLALLQQDIDYRELLLSNGLSFWGGVRSMTPVLPKALEREFATDIEKLKAVVDQIYSLQSFEVSKEQQAADATIKQIQSTADFAVRRVEKEVAAIQGRESQLTRRDAMNRIASLRAQRASLEAEMEQAAAALKAAQQSVDHAVLSAAAAYAGLPPGTTEAIVNGDIKSAVIQYATSEAFLNSPEMASASQQLGHLGSQLSAAIQTAQEVRTKIEDADSLRKAIGDPSIENLSKLGQRAWANLPPEARADISRRVNEQAPVGELVMLTRNATREARNAVQNIEALRNGLASGLSQLSALPTMAQSEVNQAIDRLAANGTEFRNSTAAMLTQVAGEIQGNAQRAEAATDLYLRVCATDFVAKVGQLDPSALEQVKRALQVNSDAELAARLSSEGRNAVRHLQVRATQLVLKKAGRDVVIGDVQTLLTNVNALNVSASATALKAVLADKANPLTEQFAAARRLVLSNLDGEKLQTLATQSLTTLTKAEQTTLWGQVMSVADQQHAGTQAWASNFVAQQSLGKAAANALIDKADTSATVSQAISAATSRLQGASPDVAREVATKALALAFPGPGIAVSVAISAIEGMAHMGEQIEKMQMLSQASRELFLEEAQIAGSLNPLLLQEALANKQYQIAKVQEEASKQQAQLYSQIVLASGGAAKDLWTRVKMRRPLAFYYAEQLRERFALLDAATGMWQGGDGALAGNIEQMVRSDPQNLRLALDSEIDLFGWFDRDLDGSRTDLDQLVVHWQKLGAISSNALGLITGVGGRAPIGKVQATDSISLRNLIAVGSDDMGAFQRWLAQPARSLSVRFLIHPAQHIFGSRYRNVRIVDVGMTARSSKGERFAVVDNLLKHPGTALVSTKREATPRGVQRPYRWEVLMPANQAVTLQTNELNVAQYIHPLAVTDGAKLDLEGYSPFTVWQLSIGDGVRNLPALTDLEIRFVYYAIDDDAIVGEQDYVDSLDRARSPVAREVAWVQNFFPVPWGRWVATRSAAKAPKIGLAEGDAAMLLDFVSAAPVSEQQRPTGVNGCPLTPRNAGRPTSVRADCPPPIDLIVRKECLSRSEVSAALFDYYSGESFIRRGKPTKQSICTAAPKGWSGSLDDPESVRRNAGRLAQCAWEHLEKAQLCAQ